MYKHLKNMLSAAETVGEVVTVHQSVKGTYTGDEIRINGITDDGKEFELELTVREKRDDRD